MPYLHKDTPRLALKLFRGEPAISGFDWNFSPTHTSSPPFSTDVRADLQSLSDFRPLKTRFPYGCSPTGASPRRSPQLAGPFYKKYAVALTACGAPAGRRHRVSGSLSLPSRGPFHLSLTVLYAIGHWVVFSLGPPISHKVSRVSWYSGSCSLLSAFVYGALTLCGRLSQNRSTGLSQVNAVHDPAVHAPRFRLFRFRSPLLAESMFLSLPPGT